MDELWDNDLIQFSRLISEMESQGVFTQLNLANLGLHMDLPVPLVCELIDRAQTVYEQAKEDERIRQERERFRKQMEPVMNLLRAGQIVGLDPREMMLMALEQLEREQNQ